MLMDGDERKGVITPDMFHNLHQEGKIDFPLITEEEIEDRSKADSLAKVIAVSQTTWFIAQCISRTAQGLITTEIELITLAFAALNGILYFLWWNKPLDVKCCVPVLLLHGEDCKPVLIPPFEPKSKLFYFIELRNEMTTYRVDLATLWHVFQISWPRRIYRFVLLCQQL